MKTLVTGGAGFIGSHLVERLLADGHTVIVIDNFRTGRWENLASHLANPSLRVVPADVTRLDDIQPHFQGVAWVFHVAALADIVPSVQQPLDYHRANVEGTVTTLEAARAAGVQRFVYAASSSCYGIPEVYPTPEAAPIRPQYPYALTKYLGEQYVLHWGQVYHLPVMSLRLFNVYGPRARTTGTYGAVFGVFLAQLLAGKPCTVVGDGTQSRDFTFVTDIVEAFMRAAQSDLVGEVCNVGSGGTYSINHLVHLLGGETTYIPQRPGEPHCTFADIGKISRLLGWSPQVHFATGVQMMLEHIEQWRQAPVWDAASIAAATREWFRYLEAASEKRVGV